MGSAASVTGIGSGLTQWTINSFMGRINYDFDEIFIDTYHVGMVPADSEKIQNMVTFPGSPWDEIFLMSHLCRELMDHLLKLRAG